MNKRLAGAVVLVILMYIILTISSTVERSVAVRVGSHYSSAFAAKIQELNDSRAELMKTDPDAVRASSMIVFARRATRASIAILFTTFIFGAAQFAAARREKMADEKESA